MHLASMGSHRRILNKDGKKMEWSFLFFLNSILLGVGLAMDAFSVSMANGLNEPGMKPKRMVMIAGCYGIFQIVMPLLGWLCVHTIVQIFSKFELFIPWIALILLGYIGGKMLMDGIRNKTEEEEPPLLGIGTLIVQGIATSIDALSVGFTISEYGFVMALVCSLLVGITTFVICMAGLEIGKRVGTRLSNKASILGGVILIAIGIEIFVSNVF
jgi:putative Mn2+ efflux pump MntP